MSRSLSRRRFSQSLAVGALGVGGVLLASRFGRPPSNPMTSENPARSKPSPSRMPTAFVAHGAPTMALDPEKGAPFAAWGKVLARPRALLVVSAHWEGAPVSIGTIERRGLMYDFYGFPDALYRVRYEAPGAPELATRVEGLLAAAKLPTRRDPERALDHGVWVPLLHMFPAADVPVLEISMPSALGARALFDLGRQLAPLRDEGVLVLGSGNLTHNLRRIDWRGTGGVPAWASEFDLWVADVLSRRDFDALVDYAHRAPALREAHPTEEHLQPLLVAAGAASVAPGAVSFPVEGFEYGSLSRRSVELS